MRMGCVLKLTEEEIQDRLVAYAKSPNPKVRDEVVLQYANLVESIARRFVGACEALEDLVQEGYIGLIRSVDKYDPEMGVKFSTYATHFIIGEIKHYLRDKGKIIKEPAWLQELNQRMTKVIESLNQQLGRQPNEKEIGEVMQMPESTVRELLTTREVFKVSSLDGDKDDNPNSRDAEKIKDEKVVTFQLPIEDKIVLETALNNLKDIEQRVIADHYYKGLNQTDIARKMGISCNYVSHILRNGTKKLKKILITEEIRDTQMQRTLVSQRGGPGESPVTDSSVIDSVSGVYNRAYFVERLEEEISRAYRHRHKLAVMLVDISLPADVDNYVRMVRSDDLIYTAAQKLRENVRKMDVVARFSETSFALLLPHTESHASVVAKRLVGMLESIQVDVGRKSRTAAPSARAGIASYPKDAIKAEDLIMQAADDLGCPEDSEVTLKKAA